MSDYLFDKQGEPDPEIARLEQLMRPFAYRGKPVPPPPRRRARAVWISAGALVAALVLLLALWPKDAWIATGAEHRQLRVGAIGTVDLSPGTRARLAGTLLQLDQGTASAVIHAAPRQFIVETKRMRIVDLGCAFTVTVDAAGVGTLKVTEGRVGVSVAGGPEVTVAAGESAALTEHGAVPDVMVAPAPVPVPAPAPMPVPSPAPKPKAKTKASIKHAAPPINKVAAPAGGKPPPDDQKKKSSDSFNHDPFRDLR